MNDQPGIPKRQAFEKFEELTIFIKQMASSGMVPHGSGWTAFLYELNKVCAAVHSQPPSPVGKANLVDSQHNEWVEVFKAYSQVNKRLKSELEIWSDLSDKYVLSIRGNKREDTKTAANDETFEQEAKADFEKWMNKEEDQFPLGSGEQFGYRLGAVAAYKYRQPEIDLLTDMAAKLNKGWQEATEKLNAAPSPVGEAAKPFNLSEHELKAILDKCLKPEEIAGEDLVQHERVHELIRWFSRCGNPKWFQSHAYELVYYIATNSANKLVDLDKVKEIAYYEGVNITPELRSFCERHFPEKLTQPSPTPSRAGEISPVPESEINHEDWEAKEIRRRINEQRGSKNIAVHSLIERAFVMGYFNKSNPPADYVKDIADGHLKEAWDRCGPALIIEQPSAVSDPFIEWLDKMVKDCDEAASYEVTPSKEYWSGQSYGLSLVKEKYLILTNQNKSQ